MKFTAKTISQLHITTTNMPIPQKTGSVKRLTDQKVQEVRKKQKANKFIKKDAGASSHKAEKGKITPAPKVFAHVAEHARELIEASSQQFEAMLARKIVEKVRESVEDHQKVDATLNQGVEAPSKSLRVEENTKQHAQKVVDDKQEVAEILTSNTLRSENQQMDVDKETRLE